MAKRPPQLIVSIDLGGSLTKVAAQTLEGKYCLLGIKSEVAQIPPNILQELAATSWGESVPEANIWVATEDENGKAYGYALGNYASSQFLAHSDLKVSKLDRAVPKILGVLSVLQQKLNLPKKFSAVIGVLLPAGECSTVDREDLSERLTKVLGGFRTPVGKVSVTLKAPLVVKPEGAGLLMAYKSRTPSDYYMKKRVGVLGIGYRNSNLLIMHQGSIAGGDRHTSNLGFHTLLEAIGREIGSTVESSELAAFVTGVGFKIDRLYLEQYLRSLGKSNRLEGVARAISRSLVTYTHQLEEWFKRVRVDTLDSIVLYGGTTEYFRENLDSRFRKLDEIVWHGGVRVEDSLIESLLLEQTQSVLNYRFVDPWCYLHYLCEGQPDYKQWGLDSLVKSPTARDEE